VRAAKAEGGEKHAAVQTALEHKNHNPLRTELQKAAQVSHAPFSSALGRLRRGRFDGHGLAVLPILMRAVDGFQLLVQFPALGPGHRWFGCVRHAFSPYGILA
jgi:hypothetical protein